MPKLWALVRSVATQVGSKLVGVTLPTGRLPMPAEPPSADDFVRGGFLGIGLTYFVAPGILSWSLHSKALLDQAMQFLRIRI